MIRTKNASGDYGLHITGDYWRIEGLTVAHATKGIVLDGSVGTVIDGVEVYDIGDEAVHFRTCSSDGVLRNSFVHDTGRNSAAVRRRRLRRLGQLELVEVRVHRPDRGRRPRATTPSGC